MAGHSKWKQIKHYKAATDKKRGALFTKLIREITVAAKQGGGDPDGNPRLRTAIDNAKAQSMPKENIERAVLKGTGELEGVDYVDVVYEAYGPGGVAIMIQALTDNPTRTVAEVRAKLSRLGGNFGSTNSVAFMFDRKGQIVVPAGSLDEDASMEKALEAGAEDFVKEDDAFVITTAPADLHAVSQALAKAGLKANVGGVRVDPEEHGARRGRERRGAAQAHRGARGTRRRAEGRRELRHGRLGDGAGVTRSAPRPVIVLGIDPGTAITGYGVVRSRRPAASQLVECGVIRTSPRAPLALALHDIFEGVTELIERHQPDALAVEDVFYARNVRTTVVLGHARGVVLLAGARAGVTDARVRARADQEDRRRPRRRHQGTGAVHGRAPAAPQERAAARRRRGRRRLRAHVRHVRGHGAAAPPGRRMIARLKGTLVAKGIDRIEIMTAGGVGYELLIPLGVLESLPRTGDEVTLHTALVVKEDGWQLFGFGDAHDRALFHTLLGASGVGPALALGLISALGSGRVVRAIRDRDLATLQGVPRVGKKIAERLCVELGDKMKDFAGAESPRPAGDEAGGRRRRRGARAGRARVRDDRRREGGAQRARARAARRARRPT